MLLLRVQDFEKNVNVLADEELVEGTGSCEKIGESILSFLRADFMTASERLILKYRVKIDAHNDVLPALVLISFLISSM